MQGQKRLKRASVLLIGAGGLGSPLALYLAAAGVGHLGIVDFDVVDFSNLQRQVLHTTSDVGRKKLDSAKDHIRAINPEIEVTTFETRLSSANAMQVIAPFDVVVDGTDNFPTRYLVNDACVLSAKPNVYGSIFRFDGQASVFFPPDGPCYRCLYPEPPPPGMVPSCAEGGVLGILPGVIGCIQATEVIKLILGNGESLIGRLLLYDALRMRFRELRVRRNPDCPVCGESPIIRELIDYEQFCGVGDHEETSRLGSSWEITVAELHDQRLRGDDLLLLDVRNMEEWQICHISGARLLPLGDLPSRIHELDSAREIVVHCKSGVRSARAVAFLLQSGFRKVRNLRGGITEWANKIDRSMPTY
jgi:adenylyltransferase/sulfurtransferase